MSIPKSVDIACHNLMWTRWKLDNQRLKYFMVKQLGSFTNESRLVNDSADYFRRYICKHHVFTYSSSSFSSITRRFRSSIILVVCTLVATCSRTYVDRFFKNSELSLFRLLSRLLSHWFGFRASLVDSNNIILSSIWWGHQVIIITWLLSRVDTATSYRLTQ